MRLARAGSLPVQIDSSPQAVRCVVAPAQPVQESDHTHPPFRNGAVMVSGRSGDAVHHSVHRPHQRLLGFWQERGASNAVEKLLSIVRIKAAVLRDGSSSDRPVEENRAGRCRHLNAGDIVPATGCFWNPEICSLMKPCSRAKHPGGKAAALLPAEDPAGAGGLTRSGWNPCGERTATAVVCAHWRETEFVECLSACNSGR